MKFRPISPKFFCLLLATFTHFCLASDHADIKQEALAAAGEIYGAAYFVSVTNQICFNSGLIDKEQLSIEFKQWANRNLNILLSAEIAIIQITGEPPQTEPGQPRTLAYEKAKLVEEAYRVAEEKFNADKQQYCDSFVKNLSSMRLELQLLAASGLEKLRNCKTQLPASSTPEHP